MLTGTLLAFVHSETPTQVSDPASAGLTFAEFDSTCTSGVSACHRNENRWMIAVSRCQRPWWFSARLTI